MKGQRLVAGIIVLAFCSVAAGQQASRGTPPWGDNVKVSGDLRYRHELIEATGQQNRNRQRVRARLGLRAHVSKSAELGFRIATGGSDPVSSNQTIGDGFQRKSFGLDLAYVAWRPAPAPGLDVLAGKMKNPFQRPAGSQLVWDGDLNPEGLAVRYGGKAGSFDVFANAAYFWVQERSRQDDSGMLGGQVGIEAPLPMAASSVKGGITYYHYLNAKGWPTFYDPKSAFGNSVDASGRYAEDFHLVEGFAQIGFEAAELPFVLTADYVTNRGARANNQGWIAGLIVGKARKPGSWQFSYFYRTMEADAVVGAFSNSDFGGGGTDNKGHIAGFAYQLAKGVQCGATYFYNTIPRTGDTTYQRLQLDAAFTF